MMDLRGRSFLYKKVLQEHYDKVYKENLSHSDPMAYIESKYCDVTSPNFCSYMTEDQRSIATAMRKECYKQEENIRLDLPGMIMH